MSEWSDAYRSRVAALTARLDAPSAMSERDALKAELIAIGKGLDQGGEHR